MPLHDLAHEATVTEGLVRVHVKDLKARRLGRVGLKVCGERRAGIWGKLRLRRQARPLADLIRISRAVTGILANGGEKALEHVRDRIAQIGEIERGLAYRRGEEAAQRDG